MSIGESSKTTNSIEREVSGAQARKIAVNWTCVELSIVNIPSRCDSNWSWVLCHHKFYEWSFYTEFFIPLATVTSDVNIGCCGKCLGYSYWPSSIIFRITLNEHLYQRSLHWKQISLRNTVSNVKIAFLRTNLKQPHGIEKTQCLYCVIPTFYWLRRNLVFIEYM